MNLLEKKVHDLHQQGTKANSTYIFPTTINVNKGDEGAAASIVHSLSQSFIKGDHDRDVDMSISSMNHSFRPPIGTGRSCFMEDEPVELINRSTLSNTHDSMLAEEDGLQRLTMLQQRNQLMPVHLRSAYAAEFPGIQVCEKAMRTGSKDVLIDIGNQAGRTFSVTETREVKTTKTFTDTYVKGPARAITPSKRSIFRRVKKWTPTAMKKSEIP
jgi:hypothetical protein